LSFAEPGETNADGLVDDRDASIMATHWGESAEAETPVVDVETPVETPMVALEPTFIGPRQAPASTTARRRIEPCSAVERSAPRVATAHDVALSEISNAESLDYRLARSYVMTSQEPQRRKVGPWVALDQTIDLALMQ
jgi:hypothetical protein